MRTAALGWRHHRILVLAADETDERTGLGVVRKDGGISAVAALQRDVADIQPIPALLFLRAVTAEAASLQDGPDIAREIRRGDEAGFRQHPRERREANSALKLTDDVKAIPHYEGIIREPSAPSLT